MEKISKKNMILCFLFVEATSHEQIEIKVDNLRQMSVVSGQLQQLSGTVAKFVECKSRQKKFINPWVITMLALRTLQPHRKSRRISCHLSHSTSLKANASRLLNASSPEKCKSYFHPDEH